MGEALGRGIPVVPVLLYVAAMPSRAALPDDVNALPPYSYNSNRNRFGPWVVGYVFVIGPRFSEQSKIGNLWQQIGRFVM